MRPLTSFEHVAAAIEKSLISATAPSNTPSGETAEAAASTASFEMSIPRTPNPWSVRCRTMPRPIPPPAPVTITYSIFEVTIRPSLKLVGPILIFS